MKFHNLQQGLTLGEAWEKRMEKLLRLVYDDIRPASMDEQREGIDRVGTVKGSGVVHRIEIKTDLRGQIDGWKARYPTTSVLNRWRSPHRQKNTVRKHREYP